jgi:hypothetical protein
MERKQVGGTDEKLPVLGENQEFFNFNNLD